MSDWYCAKCGQRSGMYGHLGDCPTVLAPETTTEDRGGRVMDDATQNLVDGLPHVGPGPARVQVMPPSPETARRFFEAYCPVCMTHEGMFELHDERVQQKVDEHNALHLSTPLPDQRPPVSPEQREALLATVRAATAEYFREDLPEDGRDESDTIVDAILARFSLPERPTVSPEQRKAMIFTLVELVPTSTGQGISYAAAAEYVDALIARFSLPVLDVEKVARWLSAEFDDTNGQDHTAEESWDFWGEDATRVAAALVASLPTLTVDGTPSDTERNES